MPKLLSEEGYVSIEALPTFDEGTSIVDAFKTINKGNARGFILEASNTTSYVDAKQLAEQLAASHKLKFGLKLGDATLGWLCTQPDAEQAVTNLDTGTLSPDADSAPIAEAIGRGVTLVKADSERIGVLFPDKKMFELGTRRIYFMCDDDHRNLDPGQGRCGICAKPITKTVVA